MGQLVFNLIITALVLINFILLFGIVKSSLETDDVIRELTDCYKDILETQGRINEKADDRLLGIEHWIEEAIKWMSRQQGQTRRNAANIAKLKDESAFDKEKETDLPDIETLQGDPEADNGQTR